MTDSSKNSIHPDRNQHPTNVDVHGGTTRETVDAAAEQIRIFVEQYLCDNGIGVQLTEALILDLLAGNGLAYPDAVDTVKGMLGTAIGDVIVVSPFGGTSYDLERVIASAASLDFLVRLARKVDPRVIPDEVIPSDFVVGNCLALFHELKHEPVAVS